MVVWDLYADHRHFDAPFRRRTVRQKLIAIADREEMADLEGRPRSRTGSRGSPEVEDRPRQAYIFILVNTGTSHLPAHFSRSPQGGILAPEKARK